MPLPYLSCAIMAEAVSSYFSGPTSSGPSAVNTCPQPLQLIHRCGQRRLARDPHQRLRLLLRINLAAGALRTTVAMRQLRMGDGDLLGAAVRGGAIAHVTAS